jgi:predicted AAA+ superfamily ATPase
MEALFNTTRQLINKTTSRFVRYIYSSINWDNRMIGLTGPRGVGKTTMILQHIKNSLDITETLYVSAEDFFFADNKLIDLAQRFVKYGGKYLFIDEIHKYKNWSRELKLIYDYHPNLKIVFTGSSVLDIKKGASDLSRRAVMYHLQGLSFREYLELFHKIIVNSYDIDSVLSHKVNIPGLEHPLVYFESYLKKGYYPFALEDDYNTKLKQIVNQTLEIDIPYYADMNVSTGRKLKQLLAIVSKSVPFKPNFSSIATMLSASRNNISDYFHYIEEAGMIMQLRDTTSGIRGLGKVEKIFLDNSNLIYALVEAQANVGNVRETFFLNQMRVNYDVIASKVADFEFNDITFEVGGKNKAKKQISNIENGFIIKDDIEYGFGNVIPLWQFGLMY